MCQASIFFALLSSVVNTFDSSLRSSSSMDVLLVLCTVLPAVIAVAYEVPFGLMREVGKWWVERCVKLGKQPQAPTATVSTHG
eukprot:1847669-Prymnesium_polylepis.2